MALDCISGHRLTFKNHFLMHCGCLTLETLYLNNIIHQSGIRIWWCFPLKKKHDFKWRRSDLTIVGTPHQVAGQQDLPWNIQLMPILFDDKHVDLPVYIYIYVERTFWVYFVPTLICPHACFLAQVHIYIYIHMWRGPFGFISFLRSYVHTRAFLHTYIYYIYIHIYIYVERTFWVYFVPTLICPHACFLAQVHIYIYIHMWRGPFGFISFLRSYVHTRAFLHTYIYIYIYTYVARMVMNQFANSWITRGWGFPVPALRISCWYDSGTPNTCELWDKKRDLRLETTGGDPSKYPKTMVKVQANYINWGE